MKIEYARATRINPRFIFRAYAKRYDKEMIAYAETKVDGRVTLTAIVF